jgi:peptidyl-tRNA hydrolase
MNPVLYIVVNKELQMTAGKVAAQAVHAAMKVPERGSYFADFTRRTVIVLEAKNTETIKNLQEYLMMAGIWSGYYIDEGANEIDPYSVTALAVEPIDADDNEKRAIFEQLPLYSGRVKPVESDYLLALTHIERLAQYTSLPWYVRKTVAWLYNGERGRIK